MEELEVKAGLELFQKKELLEMFPSAECKMADKREFMIEAILTAEIPDKETADFKDKLALKKAEIADDKETADFKDRALLGKEAAEKEKKRFKRELELKDNEIAALKKAVADKPKIHKPPPASEKKDAPVEYIVVHKILEDNNIYIPGALYLSEKPERIKRFLRDGQIRIKD